MERGEFWSEVGVRVIGFICAAIMLCILLAVLVPADTQELINLVDVTILILGLCWGVTIIAMSRRRLRDAGFGAKSYLWLLLPVVGWIVFLVRLCKK